MEIIDTDTAPYLYVDIADNWEIGANDEIWIDHRRGYPVARF